VDETRRLLRSKLCRFGRDSLCCGKKAPSMMPPPVSAPGPDTVTATVPATLPTQVAALVSALASTAAPALGPEAIFPSGYAALDAVLPGGGWPAAALTELLLPQAGLGELRLLAPTLRRLSAEGAETLWFDPPMQPNAWALQALGVAPQQLLLIRPRGWVPGAASKRTGVQDMLWALEQTLRSGHRGAVLAWLPARLPGGTMPLRRLQLAAQTHAGPVFLLRDEAAAANASPAPLRLRLASAGADALQVQVLKRRGAPVALPLLLQLPPVLAPTALARARPAAAKVVATAAVLNGS
jgi:protein ImuA